MRNLFLITYLISPQVVTALFLYKLILDRILMNLLEVSTTTLNKYRTRWGTEGCGGVNGAEEGTPHTARQFLSDSDQV